MHINRQDKKNSKANSDPQQLSGYLLIMNGCVVVAH